jgi:hypothetical protein
VLRWYWRHRTDECRVDGVTEFGDVMVQVGYAVRYGEDSVLN